MRREGTKKVREYEGSGCKPQEAQSLTKNHCSLSMRRGVVHLKLGGRGEFTRAGRSGRKHDDRAKFWDTGQVRHRPPCGFCLILNLSCYSRVLE